MSRSWRPAEDIVAGPAFTELVEGPARRWGAPPHVAASLAWKAYSYSLAMPVVSACVTGNPVPDASVEQVGVQLSDRTPFVHFTFGRDGSGHRYLAGHNPMTQIKATLIDAHLQPLLDRMVRETRVGARTLRGELAYGIAQLHQRAGPDRSPELLISELGLADAVRVVRGPDEGPRIARRTCCLGFAAPGLDARLCADCIVPPRPN